MGGGAGSGGGLGHYAVQLAVAFGYRVLAVDIGEERLEFARALGAERAVDASDAAAVARELGGVVGSLVFSARIAGYQLGLDLLRARGLFVAVGIPPSSDGDFRVNPFVLLMKEPTIIFSAVGTVQDMRELVDLAARGVVRTHVARTGPLSELPDIFDELESASYLGRAVLTDLSS